MSFKKKQTDAPGQTAIDRPAPQPQPQPETRNDIPTGETTRFAEGAVVFKPHENAPDFILCDIFIQPDKFKAWIDDMKRYYRISQKYGIQLKVVMKESKDGYYYLEADTYTNEK